VTVPEGESGLREAVGRRGSLTGTLGAVFWSFFGVRRGRDHERDLSQLNPVHVIVAGVLVAVAFVIVLVVVVNWVISSGVAA